MAALFGTVFTTVGADFARVFIEFRPGAEDQVAEALARANVQLHHEFAELNAVAVTVPVQSLRGLQNNANITLIEEDPVRELLSEVVPYGVDRVQATDLWDANDDGVLDPGAVTGAGIKVGVIDSGIAATHPDFAGVAITGEPTGWNTDGLTHGTHVCGIIAANLNGNGVVGVSPGKVSLHMVKVFGASGEWIYASDLLDAVKHAVAAGCRVINMSLGGAQSSQVEERGFNSLYNRGVLLVAGAGNGGNTSVLYPAGYAAVISVAATDMNNNVASFSQRNPDVELAAPGVNIYSTVPSGWAYYSGTSMATAHGSAVAALIWSKYPKKSNTSVRSALHSGALDLGLAGRDTSYGYGLVQAKNSLTQLAVTK